MNLSKNLVLCLSAGAVAGSLWMLRSSPQAVRTPDVDSVSLLVRFGAGDQAPAIWDGSVEATTGAIDAVRNPRPRPADKIGVNNAWLLSSDWSPRFQNRSWEQEPMRGTVRELQFPALVVGVSNRAATLRFQTRQGEFRVNAADISFGVRKSYLNGRVTVEQARADMEEVSRNLAAAYPDADKGITAKLVPLETWMLGQVRPYLLVLLAAVGFVLLIACVNVANLLLARSTARTREFAVRVALGASRGRVVRQLLTESVLLSLAGGALGLLAANWGMQAALGWLPSALPRAEEIAIDGRVLLVTLAASLLVGILFGLAPAFKAARTELPGALKVF